MLSKNPSTINTYSCFDTAAAYGSERGLIKSRDEVFITSKLWCNCNHHDLVLPALNNTLQKLGMEYVDLYLVHLLLRLKKEAASFEFAKENILPSWDMKGTWEAMEECCRLGLAKSIGVGNFSCKKLSQLLQYATIPPAVNQVEMNAAWQQVKLREFCREKGIHVSAWSPLGANGAIWGSLAVVENPLLKEISAAKGKSLAQEAGNGVCGSLSGALAGEVEEGSSRQGFQGGGSSSMGHERDMGGHGRVLQIGLSQIYWSQQLQLQEALPASPVCCHPSCR
ncbi:hypothetical protein AAG906_027846 [Vitis piasezkii]